MRYIVSLFTITLFAVSLATAQENTVLQYEDEVPDYERTAREISASGKEEIVTKGKMLLPPEEGDDTKTRFILTIIAKDASHPDNLDQRGMVEEAFLDMLEEAEHDQIKDFLLTQFHLFGSEASLEPLSRYLTHEQLYVNSAIAIIQIGSPTGAQYLIDALPEVNNEAKAMFLRGVGDLNYDGDFEVIVPYTTNENDGVRLAAIYALANIGGLHVHDALLKAVRGEKGLMKHQAVSYLFDYANDLAKQGQAYTAAQIAYDALKRYTKAEETHIQCAALDVLVHAKGHHSINDLMMYAASEHSDVSAQALALAKKLPRKVFMQMWENKAQRSPEELRGKIMDMLYSWDDYLAMMDIEYPPVSLDEPNENGFVPLFNNVDLTGWTGDTNGYIVENSNLICLGGNLYTEKEYSDFVLRFEFKLPPGGNNGLGIRTPMGKNAAYHGMELQILHDSHPMYKGIKPWQAHGSIYGVVPAKRGYLREPGLWNQQEVIAYGNKIIIRLNGTTIVNANIDKAALLGTIDGNEHPGLDNESGHIAFLGHGSPVEFRNIRVKELEQPDEEETPAEEANVEESSEAEDSKSENDDSTEN